MKAFIHLYANLILFRTEKDQEKAGLLAKDLVRLLATHQRTIPETLLEEFEIHLRNFWTSRYQHTRNEEYPLLLHELQLQQVERLRHNLNGIPASQLANILFTALKIGKVEWASEVLSWLGPRIMDAKAELINPILHTHLLFEQKRYLDASKFLPHYITYGELKDMAFYTIAAKLDIKICYELNCLLDEEYFNMFRATQIKLKRDKTLTPERRAQRERFFLLVMKLYRAKDYLRQSPNADLAKRLQDVWEALANKSEPVVDADWLEDKWLELRKP
ncbi:MAG: hypothetical protein ABIQ93_12100 [Saprospiraceae bacterium]